MKYVLYDIIEDEIMVFERRGFWGFKYCITNGGTLAYHIRLHPRSYPDRFVVLGCLYC